MNPFVLLLMSHILGDGIFTSSRLATLKRNSGILYQVLAIGCHTSIHALFAGSLLLIADRPWLKAAILVFALHFFIDFIRSRVEIRQFGPGRLYVKRSEFISWISRGNRELMNKSKLGSWFLINILDQGAHIVSLYAISLLI